MDCPYCKKEMKRGVIPAFRDYRIQWIEGEKYDPFDGVKHETVRLSPPTFLSNSHADAWYCAGCRSVVVPVPEFESPREAITRKWNSLTDTLSQRLKASEARRAAERREKQSAERKKKDPWEVE